MAATAASRPIHGQSTWQPRRRRDSSSGRYCAPGSWEAVLDGTRAWCDAVKLAAAGAGPAFALARPAGHHATRDVAMGFGLVNYAAAAAAAAVDAGASVGILDWDVHHGNGVVAIFRADSLQDACFFARSVQDACFFARGAERARS